MGQHCDSHFIPPVPAVFSSVSMNGETETLKSLKRELSLATQLASCGVNTRWWSVDAARAPATGLEVRTPHATLLATAYVALSP